MKQLSLLFATETLETSTIDDQLVRLGFAETSRTGVSGTRARKLIEGLAKPGPDREALLQSLDVLVHDLSESADPLRALLNFSRLCDGMPKRAAWFGELREDARLRRRVCDLMSFSQSVADNLIRRPELLAVLRNDVAVPSRPEMRKAAKAAVDEFENAKEQLEALRRFRKTETFRIAVLDMESRTWNDEDDFNRVVRQISDLAIVSIQTALAILAPDTTGFAVMLLGKGGARELNYSSDVDLIFIHDGDSPAMNTLGTALLKAITDTTMEGTLWRADMRLRPDGKSGALVTPMGYALSYYESFAAAWEWQALLKARGVAGDARLARRFRKFTRGVTWAKRADDSHLGEMLAMKKRMEATLEGSDPENVKQGPGAIRDAEWVVQQLQMMIGPERRRARAAATLRALRRLDEFSSLSHREVEQLREGYLYLRVLEHRLQLMDERAVRDLPTDPAERAALARRMGETARGAVACRHLEEDHARHRAQIRAAAERLFWAWKEEHGEDEVEKFGLLLDSLSTEAQVRLGRIAGGTSTNPFPAPFARQVRVALPAALDALDGAADREKAISNLERLCEASGNRLSLLRSLGDSPGLARAVYAILGGSSRLTDTLVRFPQLLDLAANRASLAKRKPFEEARFDCIDFCLPFEDRAAGLRQWKDREMLRIGLRDLAIGASPQEITAEIADLCQSCLQFANSEIARRRPNSSQIEFAVLGMGKLGGGEMHYASDADIMFVFNQPPGSRWETHDAAREATHWAEELTRLMGERTRDGVCFELDARLRPDGRSGPLVRTIQGFIDYFERESAGLAVWERQALTRARYVAGDPATSGRLMAAIRSVAFPDEWRPEWSDELRHIKHRVENERAAKGARSGVIDVKLGPGGISDIEWTAQWLALRHGARVVPMQTPNTLRQLEAAQGAGLLTEAEFTALQNAYVFLRRAELRLQITQEGGVKAIKTGTTEFEAWARAIYPTDESAAERFTEEWTHFTAEARKVFERVRNEI
jgi:glutamate-ammonia-ligase adenylyltransferase